MEAQSSETCAPKAVKIGDVVLMHDDSPRIRWKMAVVENLIKGKDGLTRAVEIKTSNGKTNQSIAKLHLLEISIN